MRLPRRRFLFSSLVGALGATLPPAHGQAASKAEPSAPKAPPKPPALPADKVRDVVGQSHRNLDAVRALVDETPLLVNACWDWDGGDFETALQAAAHTGRREIAEFLLSRHARLDLYAAAMLGHLDFVKAALAPNPVALAAVPGPHGFTLLHCAKQGGEKGKPIYDYLLAQGVPEVLRLPLPFRWPGGASPL